jgi:hypothetical protein
MSTFYGMIQGNRGAATRGGSANSGFKSTAQSWENSIINYLDYDKEDKLRLTIAVAEGSSTYGDEVFRGTFEEFKEMCKMYKEYKNKDYIK